MRTSSVREIPRTVMAEIITATSARVKAVVTETATAADLAREDHRGMAAREDSVATETTTAREDLKDREIPRTEVRARVTETDVASVRAKATEMETEMAADLAREDHRGTAARDASEEKTVITAARDVSADRSHRADSVPAVQEEAADPTQSSHRS